MASDTKPSLADELAAAQEWWRDAGVDYAFADEPMVWAGNDAEAEESASSDGSPETRRTAPAVESKPVPPPLPVIGGEKAAWPQTLDAFHAWWLTEPSLGPGGPNARIAPRGNAGAALMAIVAEPEESDRDQLLSGPQGELLASFLGRAGIAMDQVYVASALPRRTPFADWRTLAETGLGDVLLHHIGLVAPQRVIVFGRDILPLLGHDPAQTPAILREINHARGSVAALAARSLEAMLKLPAIRKDLWRQWQDWTDG